LNVDDLEEIEGGLCIRIARSKTDQERQGAVIAIVPGVFVLGPAPSRARDGENSCKSPSNKRGIAWYTILEGRWCDMARRRPPVNLDPLLEGDLA
jgi:hypothetical protein